MSGHVDRDAQAASSGTSTKPGNIRWRSVMAVRIAAGSYAKRGPIRRARFGCMPPMPNEILPSAWFAPAHRRAHVGEARSVV